MGKASIINRKYIFFGGENFDKTKRDNYVCEHTGRHYYK